MDPGTFNQRHWRPEHLFGYGKVLTQPNWKTADAPLRYIPSAVSKTLRRYSRYQTKVAHHPAPIPVDESVVGPSRNPC
jgi:hypothetical protein